VWAFVTFVFNGNQNFAGIYINGILDTSTTSAVSTVAHTSQPIKMAAATIDDIRIFNQALNSTEIESLYTLGGWSTLNQGLVAYYPFNGNSNDSSGYGNNGTNNGATLTADRFDNANGAYIFNGTSNYIEVPESPNLINQHITLAAWVSPSQSSRMIVLGKLVFANAADEQYTLTIEGGFKPWVSIKRNSNCVPGAGWNTASGVDTIVTNTWTFMTGTWDGTVLRIYQNGVLDSLNTSVPAGAIDSCTGGDLRIGANWSSDPIYFNGKIDDIRIYNRALSDSEISELYHLDGWPEAPLAVQLSYFTSSVQPNKLVQLQWTTISETNNYGFYVERRADSTKPFVQLPNSFVAGHATTLAQQHYEWTDSTATAGTYYYRLKQVDLTGAFSYSSTITLHVNGVEGVKTGKNLPKTFALSQNYPNPFNPTTTIQYQLPKASFVHLSIFNVLGQEVRVLVNETEQAGYKSISFDGGNLASGMYFYRISAGSFTDVKKMILIK
jgi:hypothetical protein